MIMIFRKKYLIPFLLLFFVELCNAQILKNTDDLDFYKKKILYCLNYLSKTDSLAYVNRLRADKVLSCFPEYHGMKMLYTHYLTVWDDPQYNIEEFCTRDYVVLLEVDTEERYKDFLVSMNMDDEIVEIKERKVYSKLKSLKKKKRLKKWDRDLLNFLETLRNAILEDGFNINNYKKGFDTNYTDTNDPYFPFHYTHSGYFVLKDGAGNRYGELFCRQVRGGVHANKYIERYLFFSSMFEPWSFYIAE